MLTIHKFPLNITEQQQVMLPATARFLSAQFQDGALKAWVLLDDADEARFPVTVRILATGQDAQVLSKGYVHLATVQEAHGLFIWHVCVPGLHR